MKFEESEEYKKTFEYQMIELNKRWNEFTEVLFKPILKLISKFIK